jgi:hypothetical protein
LIDKLAHIEAGLDDAADALEQTAVSIDRLRAGKSDQVADEVTALTTRLQEPAKRLAELLRTVNNS